ncbi:MAG TPA: hypothetical protein VFC63_03870 [Blastocatellia bacterium]|nr:hypothetical protein [Blastocatellia bacterium]
MATYAPCPQCQNANANPVKFTWWGGMLGPKLLSHVKCTQCGTAYNGKSGKSNTTGILIYFGVAFVVAFIIMIVIGIALVATK